MTTENVSAHVVKMYALDLEWQQNIRNRIDQVVTDKETAEKLKVTTLCDLCASTTIQLCEAHTFITREVILLALHSARVIAKWCRERRDLDYQCIILFLLFYYIII